jgi:hypothetical protein
MATLHEWLEDSLGDPKANAMPEGFTYFTEDPTPRERLGNYVQIMSRGIQVTNTQEVVLKYGLQSEIGYQMAKCLKELAFDCELALLTQTTAVAGSMTPPVPRKFMGLPGWIVTNVYDNGGTSRDLTLDIINEALEQCYLVGGSPKVLMVSPRNKSIISRFMADSFRYMKSETTKIGSVVTVIESDFGQLKVVVNRWMPNNIIYGLSMEYIKKAFLRPFAQGDVAPKIADMERRNVVGEWTLEMRAEKAHFVIKDLNGVLPAFSS